MPLGRRHAELTQAPGLIGYCLENFGTTLLVVSVNLVYALTVYIGEVRVLMRITGWKLVRAVPQHHVKTTKTQERPTVHTEPGGKPQFVEKVAFSLLKILDRQNMLGGFYCKHGCPRSEEWILNNHYWNAGPSIQSTHRLRKTKQNHKSQQVTNLDQKPTPASLATTKHIATTTPCQTLNSNAQYWCNNMRSPQNSP